MGRTKRRERTPLSREATVGGQGRGKRLGWKVCAWFRWVQWMCEALFVCHAASCEEVMTSRCKATNAYSFYLFSCLKWYKFKFAYLLKALFGYFVYFYSSVPLLWINPTRLQMIYIFFTFFFSRTSLSVTFSLFSNPICLFWHLVQLASSTSSSSPGNTWFYVTQHCVDFLGPNHQKHWAETGWRPGRAAGSGSLSRTGNTSNLVIRQMPFGWFCSETINVIF